MWAQVNETWRRHALPNALPLPPPPPLAPPLPSQTFFPFWVAVLLLTLLDFQTPSLRNIGNIYMFLVSRACGKVSNSSFPVWQQLTAEPLRCKSKSTDFLF